MNDILNKSVDAVDPVPIETQQQAYNWLLALVEEMLYWRRQCDLISDVKLKNRAMWTYLEKAGRVSGATEALFNTGFVNHLVYKEVSQKVANSLIPTVAKVVD